MLIKIVNPNTSASFTERARLVATQVAASGTTIVAGAPMSGAASVECHVDEARAALGVIEEVASGEAQGVDAYVIACFGDTGVAAAREVARGPVVGMTEAALFAACLVAHRFSIITLPARTRIHAQRVVNEIGLSVPGRCGPIRAIDVPVLFGEEEDQAVYDAILAEARKAIADDHAEAIILGCAGLAHFVDQLTETLGIPVIDGVGVAVKMAEALVVTGLRTSKASSFAYPRAGAPTDLPMSTEATTEVIK